MESSKKCKLIQHQKSQQKHYAGEEIVFCTKDFPFLAEDDILEVYNPEEDNPRLLLKVGKGSLRDDFANRDAMSIEQSIASLFGLKPYSDVLVRKVRREDVELDSVELTFKDQYLGRSEMWRLKNSLIDTCLYLGKKIEFISTIRCQVHEMWSHGDKVASGLITPLTKIVFRSSTSMVYLFIQMSSEMWEFDIHGDLYFEKAVNGFLAQLFTKWKKTGSSHEVTIVLFSRLYYEATSLDQFPESVRLCLQTDYKGRFYEDYYRIAVQNGRYDDWGNTLIFLKHIFVDYQRNLLSHHKKGNPGRKLPRSTISSAARGNFLEVLNMSLNVFEKHYKDRSFDRTGQLSVVITPGVGVFEVDRDLTNLTMQRIIDNGVGSDLVCVGEQPLHAVPLLLKFNHKSTSQSNMEDYSMPHWINLSFYSTKKKVGYSSYIPRIKLPMQRPWSGSGKRGGWDWTARPRSQIHKVEQECPFETPWPNSVYDYDDYDQKIFQASGTSGESETHPNLPRRPRQPLIKKRPHPFFSLHPRFFKRQNSEPEISLFTDFPQPGTSTGRNDENYKGEEGSGGLEHSPELSLPSPAITIPGPIKRTQPLSTQLYSSSFGALNIEMKSKGGRSVSRDNWLYDDVWNGKISSPGSSSLQSGTPPKDKGIIYTKEVKDRRISSKALINPFDPSHALIKLTSSRRRWTHIFPRGPTGALIQQHHRFSTHSALEIVPEGLDSPVLHQSPSKGLFHGTPSRSGRNSVTRSNSATDGKLTLLWGATGEQEWTPALQTGVDWKSLTIPACLPLTTDYFPDERSMETDYVVSDYSLLPDDVNSEYAQQRLVYRHPLTTLQVFSQLVNQRLTQGFQLVIRPPPNDSGIPSTPTRFHYTMNPERENSGDWEEYILSIGRVFHKIQLEGSTITVTRYRPKHAYPSLKFHYTYRLNSPNSQSYEVSAAVFSTEKLENYSWNYLDHYICTRGDKGYALHETLKFWRFRMYILPSSQSATKRILEGSEKTNLYARIREEERSGLVDNFLKLLEGVVNRLKRATCPRKSKGGIGPVIGGNSNTSTSTPQNPIVQGGRERLGSTKISDKGKPRIGLRDFLGEEKSGLEGQTGEFSYPESLPSSVPEAFLQLGQGGGASGEVDETEVVLVPSTPLRVILESMCLPNSGFSFVKSGDLPHWTFLSGDAVHWLMRHMDGILTEEEGVAKYEEMLNEGLISHASGAGFTKGHAGFIYGFYFYSIRCFSKDGAKFRSVNLEMFEDDWMEVGVDPRPFSRIKIDVTSEGAKGEESKPIHSNPPIYKGVYLDVDLGKKSERQEWGHLQYQSTYRGDEAFELVVQWVQATGSVITELIQGWSRKAQQCNLQLIPIPSDPFAVSSSFNSDSLRGPIFIPLDTAPINPSLQDLGLDSFGGILMDFQKGILSSFGFISCLNPSPDPTPNYHFVHLTGNMFISIPNSSTLPPDQVSSRVRKRYESPGLSGANEDFITRHVSGKKTEGLLEDRGIGFLWSWNYMVSKRWKTSSTPALADEAFMMKVLRDFQAFCANQDDRLVTLWEKMTGDADSPLRSPDSTSTEPTSPSSSE